MQATVFLQSLLHLSMGVEIHCIRALSAPFTTSNPTFWLSKRDLKPSPSMAEWRIPGLFSIVLEEVKVGQSDKSLDFQSIKMGVRTKKQAPNPGSRTGLKNVDSANDPNRMGVLPSDPAL